MVHEGQGVKGRVVERVAGEGGGVVGHEVGGGVGSLLLEQNDACHNGAKGEGHVVTVKGLIAAVMMMIIIITTHMYHYNHHHNTQTPL